MTAINPEGILHEDLTTVSDVIPFLKECISKRKDVPRGSLLQIQLITNISVPTYEKTNYNDSSAEKDTLKVVVTDGDSQVFALVPESLPGISMKTPPGTKIRITQPVPRAHGKLMILTKTNCEVLGGKVPKLIEKWELQKKMAIKHEWGYTGSVSNVAGEAPPAWKPFGHRSSSNADLKAMRKMKTTDVVVAGGKKEGVEEAKSQFDVQRDEAIQEGVAVNKSKTFQKPKKHLLAKEITDIMNQGFSQVEAETAMRRFKNFHKALKFLKESRDRQEGKEVPKKPIEIERKFYQRKGRMGEDEDEDRQDVPAEFKRPTNDVSLFGFIEGQIKAGGDQKLTKSLKLAVDKAPEKCIKDLEGDMERLTFKGPMNERGKHHEPRGRTGARRGVTNRGGRQGRGRGGGGDIRRPHSPQQRWYDEDDKTGRHVPPPRFQSNRQRGHHYQSNGVQYNKNYQEQRYRGTAPGQDPRSYSAPSASNSMMSTSTLVGQDSQIHDATSSYRCDPRILQTSTRNDHRMQELCGNDSYSSALPQHQGQRFPPNVSFTQYPPPAIPNHAHFTRFPPPPLPSNYNNRHFPVQAPSGQQIGLDLHHQQHQISDVSHHRLNDNDNDAKQSNLWGQAQFVTSTASGTSIYAQNQRQPPILPDNPQLVNPAYGYRSPAPIHSVVPSFQYDEEIARNPAFGAAHPGHRPPPGFTCAQSLDREYRQD